MVDLMLARNHPQVWCQSCTRMFKLTTQVVQRGFQREYAVALSAISETACPLVGYSVQRK